MKTILKNIIILLLFYCIKLFGKKGDRLNFECVLVLAPHPDDEIFGLGGSILKMIEAGTKIYIIYLTDGENSGVWPDKEEIKRHRIYDSKKICNLLGIEDSNITRFHIPDGFVPHPGQIGFDALVDTIKEAIDKIKPDAMFSPHPFDYWPFDHVACSNLASEAIKQSKGKCQLWYYWVWAWYNQKPWLINRLDYKKLHRIKIRKELSWKIELMNLYLNTVTPMGTPWCGILPKSLLKAFYKPIEVLEKIC